MEGLNFFLHRRKLIVNKLILNEAKPVVGKDIVECVGCYQPIYKLIDTFYSCSTSDPDFVEFFMHKTCAELPKMFTHPVFPKIPLTLFLPEFFLIDQGCWSCDVCRGVSQGWAYTMSDFTDFSHFVVCVKCVTSELKSLEERSRCHPCHSHPLSLVQSPALFQCHACNTAATDLSYICTKCCFWIHKSCADAPLTYQSKFHNQHPLILEYSLPKEYRHFAYLCDICTKVINPIEWIYYCANCRFFAHVKCASSTAEIIENDEADYGDLLHFPAPDEASLNKMMQQCIIKLATTNVNSELPSPAYINHWAHKKHQLALKSKLGNDDEQELLICNGCTKPISYDIKIFYECNSCTYYLHRSCAHFPKQMQHHLVGELDGEADDDRLPRCFSCGVYGNGIFTSNKLIRFDIVCASLPRIIKHKAHRHPLEQCKRSDHFLYSCKACGQYANDFIMYGCKNCKYYIHTWCALKPQMLKHQWDPHPLRLILSPKEVNDHPHEYQCEFCSD